MGRGITAGNSPELRAFRDAVLGLGWDAMLLHGRYVAGEVMWYRMPVPADGSVMLGVLRGYPDNAATFDAAVAARETEGPVRTSDMETELGRLGHWGVAVTNWGQEYAAVFSVADRTDTDAGGNTTGDGWVHVAVAPSGEAELSMRGGTTYGGWRAFQDAFASFCDGKLR